MKVHVAEGSGFCFGVKRAMDMAYRYAAGNRGRKVYSLHEIIHNPQEVERLKKAGAVRADSVKEIKKGSYAIISTHGISAAEQEELKRRCADVMDTTCPYVKKIHNIVKKLKEEKYAIIIAGDADHLEVMGILGYAGAGAAVAASARDIEAMDLSEKVGVVAQTTQSTAAYMEIIRAVQDRAFLSRYAEVRAFNTICDATKNRQAATIKLAKKSDVMVIVGGRNSANTRRLYELSRAVQKDTHHVETAAEIKKTWFRGKKAAGVSAGASTPSNVIEEAVKKIKMIGEK